jgi:3-oxoadipate enol-lactonase
VRLYHQIDGTGPAVVLLHPVGLDMTCFTALTGELSPRFQVVRLDLRGHGRSPAVACDMQLADYAEDVHELLVEFGLAPASIVGFSFGGMIAQTLALSHPTDVRALVIGACPSTLAIDQRAAMLERGTSAVRLGMEAVVEPTLERWFTPGFRTSGDAQRIARQLLADDVRGWAAAWRAISTLETQPRLAAITAPTLCLAGELDASAPPAVVRTIASAITGAQFVVVPGAPHMLFIEQPQAVARIIAGFLARV